MDRNDIRKNLKETTEEVCNMIRTQGIITGSFLWGVNKKDSDIDVLFFPNADLNFREIIREHYGFYFDSDYGDSTFYSCYVLLKGKLYNLILMRCYDTYTSWLFATCRISQRVKNDDVFRLKLENKNFRIKYFEGLVKRFK